MKTELKSILLTLILALSLFTVFASVPTFAPVAKISKALAESLDASINVDILVTTKKNDYASVEASIIELGGQVKLKLKYVNAIAASMPADKIVDLMANNDVVEVCKDEMRYPAMDPSMLDLDIKTRTASTYLSEYETTFLTAEMIEGIEPNNYWNPIAMGAEDVWYTTNDFGQGSLVVIIDTGLWAGHFMFGGTSILGGIDLSPDVGTAYEGWSSPDNHYHGTHVAGIVASTGGIVVDENDLLVQSIEYHTGMTLPEYPPIPGTKVIWLLGMAPFADLYSIKVFPHTGAGVPESYVLAGMEHALDMHLSGHYDVDVISMSLGGPTIYDGRDIEDKLVDMITTHGITLVAAAGNEGPAPITTGSPGTANTAITVGAAATPVQTRVYWDYVYDWLGIGDYLFTSETPQIYAFSSRGPTSDGRSKPTLAATGIMVMSAYHINSTPGFDQLIAWGSGTSMATPAVSGAVALLNTYAEAFPTTHGCTNPLDYKQALQNGAVWLPGYNEYDQGAGFLNAWNALLAFVNDPHKGDVYRPLSPHASLYNLPTVPINPWAETSVYEFDIVDLAPGHKLDFNFRVIDITGSIELEITDVALGVDPFWINSFEVYIQSAKRAGYWYFIDSANVWDDALFHIDDYETWWAGAVSGVYTDPYTRLAPIESGYVKIVIENDWTSFDSISGHIKITVKQEESSSEADIKISGYLKDGDWTGWIPITVPENTIKAEITLSWIRGWYSYPTNDLDLVVAYYVGGWVYNFDGATLNSPERVILEDPPTTIYLYVDAYAVHAMYLFRHREFFDLEIEFTLG